MDESLWLILDHVIHFVLNLVIFRLCICSVSVARISLLIIRRPAIFQLMFLFFETQVQLLIQTLNERRRNVFRRCAPEYGTNIVFVDYLFVCNCDALRLRKDSVVHAESENNYK